jgi:hypothetical protein
MKRTVARVAICGALSFAAGCADAPVDALAPTTAAESQGTAPTGYIDSLVPLVDTPISKIFKATGWACDPKVPTGSIRVDFYVDPVVPGGAPNPFNIAMGSAPADKLRPDLINVCDQGPGCSAGLHGWEFSFQTCNLGPGQFKLYAHAVDSQGFATLAGVPTNFFAQLCAVP